MGRHQVLRAMNGNDAGEGSLDSVMFEKLGAKTMFVLSIRFCLFHHVIFDFT